jgi:hypothetical protein
MENKKKPPMDMGRLRYQRKVSANVFARIMRKWMTPKMIRDIILREDLNYEYDYKEELL